MTMLAEAEVAPATIEAKINYLHDTGGVIYNFSGGPGSTRVESNMTHDSRVVRMQNGRAAREKYLQAGYEKGSKALGDLERSFPWFSNRPRGPLDRPRRQIGRAHV